MRRDRYRFVLAMMVFAAVTACSGSASEQTLPSSASLSMAAPPATSVSSVPVSSVVPPAVAATDVTSTVPAGVVSWPSSGVAVMVSGGELPSAVVSAYESGGGDLIDPAVWYGRFGRVGLPELVGPGVRLVGATASATRDRGGQWQRVDEVGWLAMTRDGRDALLDELAAAAGLGGAVFDSINPSQPGADCVQRDYLLAGVAWRVQGCSYAQFARMVAVSLSRTGVFASSVPVLDASLPAIVELLGDVDVREWSIEFTEPNPDGTTLRMHLVASHNTTVESVTDALATGPLVGWQQHGGDESMLFTAANGATWTAGPTSLQFDSVGRM